MLRYTIINSYDTLAQSYLNSPAQCSRASAACAIYCGGNLWSKGLLEIKGHLSSCLGECPSLHYSDLYQLNHMNQSQLIRLRKRKRIWPLPPIPPLAGPNMPNSCLPPPTFPLVLQCSEEPLPAMTHAGSCTGAGRMAQAFLLAFSVGELRQHALQHVCDSLSHSKGICHLSLFKPY